MKATILQYEVCDELPAEWPSAWFIINTINPHSYCVAKKDAIFRGSLQQSDLLIPDGVGIVWAARRLQKKKIRKIAGADLHDHMLGMLNRSGGRCFYLGAAQSTLDKIKTRIEQEQPEITAGFFSPPYKPQFTEEDNRIMIEQVNSFAPDVLFVGMTAPKQEKWVHANKDKLNVKVICSIGAVFDFYAGTTKRPPKWLISIGLEWLGRLLMEPRRLWRRTFVSGPIFIYDVLRTKRS